MTTIVMQRWHGSCHLPTLSRHAATSSISLHLRQHLLDAVLGFVADLRPGLRLEVQVALQDAVKDLLLALTPERGHTTEQDVQDYSTTPNVCLVAVVAPQHLCRMNDMCTHHKKGDFVDHPKNVKNNLQVPK